MGTATGWGRLSVGAQLRGVNGTPRRRNRHRIPRDARGLDRARMGRGKIHTVWNGVDPKRYRPGIATNAETDALRARYGIPNGVPVILYVGRLVPEKGVLPMIEAVPSVLASNPDAHLVVLGAGQMEGPMRTRIADLGVTGRVHMRAELVSEHERIVHFEMCDVGLFPSTYEPFGIVTLEAMAIGKACVAGARGVVGFREQVVPSGDGQTGLHVDGGNPTDIAWGLNEALSDRHRLATWGANGARAFSRSSRGKSPPRRLRRFIELYCRVQAIKETNYGLVLFPNWDWRSRDHWKPSANFFSGRVPYPP